MSFDDIEYYRRRAREERERAAKTDIPEAARAHLDLASHYEALVEHADLLPRTRRWCAPPEPEERR
jgi:hypothetical protein